MQSQLHPATYYTAVSIFCLLIAAIGKGGVLKLRQLSLVDHFASPHPLLDSCSCCVHHQECWHF